MQFSSRPPVVAIASSSAGGGSKMPACVGRRGQGHLHPSQGAGTMHSCSCSTQLDLASAALALWFRQPCSAVKGWRPVPAVQEFQVVLLG